MENKGKINILTAILTMIIILLVIYIVFLQNKINDLKIADNNEENEVKKTELTAKELEEFDDMLSMNPWITTTYLSINDVNLGEIMYSVANSNDEIQKEYEELYWEGEGEEESLGIEAFKITSEEVQNNIKENTGKSITDLRTMNTNFTYNVEKDAYYITHGDTNLFDVICNSGYKTSDGKYVINYIEQHSSIHKKGTVTLEKSGDRYLFISNTVTDDFDL